MKRFLCVFAFILFYVLLFSCCRHDDPNGPDDNNSINASRDKQIRMVIPWSAGSQSDQWVSGIGLIKFDKRNYIGVDSIIFVTQPYTSDTSYFCIVEMYNYADGTIIQNSTLSSNYSGNNIPYLQTGNIYKSFPDKEINVGLRMKSSIKGKYAYMGMSYLFLYRK